MFQKMFFMIAIMAISISNVFAAPTMIQGALNEDGKCSGWAWVGSNSMTPGMVESYVVHRTFRFAETDPDYKLTPHHFRVSGIIRTAGEGANRFRILDRGWGVKFSPNMRVSRNGVSGDLFGNITDVKIVGLNAKKNAIMTEASVRFLVKRQGDRCCRSPLQRHDGWLFIITAVSNKRVGGNATTRLTEDFHIYIQYLNSPLTGNITQPCSPVTASISKDAYDNVLAGKTPGGILVQGAPSNPYLKRTTATTWGALKSQ